MATEASSAGKHLVLFPLGVSGRIIPFMILARRLACKGCLVSFVFLSQRRIQIENAYETRGGKHPLIKLLPLAVDDVTTSTRIQDTMETVSSVVTTTTNVSIIGSPFASLLDRLLLDHESKPVCVITCEFTASLQQICKDKLLHHYVLFVMSATMLCFAFHAGNLATEGKLPLDSIENFTIPGLGPFPVPGAEKNMPHFLKQASNVYVAGVQNLQHCSSIIINSFQAAEPSAFASLEFLNPNKVPVLQLGPLLPDELSIQETKGSLTEEVLRFLDKQLPQSVIYVSFGSIQLPTAEKVCELGRGLIASKKPFLWMLNSPNFVELLPQGFLQDAAEIGLVTSSWVAQISVLSHPAVGVFFTHCGWNSTLEAIALGVPVLTNPSMADQYANSWLLVEQLGMGIEISKDGAPLSSNRVQEALVHLMDGEQGEKVRARAHAAMAAAAEALDLAKQNLDSFIRSLNPDDSRSTCASSASASS